MTDTIDAELDKLLKEYLTACTRQSGTAWEQEEDIAEAKAKLQALLLREREQAAKKAIETRDYDGRYDNLTAHELKILIVSHNNDILALSARLEELSRLSEEESTNQEVEDE